MNVKTASSWQLRSRQLEFGPFPLLMGIVNVTPDSFSDGGKFGTAEQAVAHALALVRDGAAIVDVGGESTRPYSQPVPLAEELSRVIPVIQQIHERVNVPISIDTSKAAVARAAIEAGADIINDVSGLRGDSEMLAVARDTGAAVCVMHMQGNPQTMQDDPAYQDVVQDIARFLRERTEELVAQGLSRDKICLDPGIGFGKTHQHNMALIARCQSFHSIGQPVMIGHSRKGFIGKFMGSAEIADRDAGTLAISILLAQQKIQLLRVHNVGLTHKAFALLEALPESF